jgi:hypothetical protein
MSMPPSPEGVPPWPNPGSGTPSPEFLAAFQAEMARLSTPQAGSQDPLTPMDSVCVAAHTLFECAVRSGFTERQGIIFAVEILTRQS